MSPKLRIRLRKLAVIVICWVVLGIIFGITDHLVLMSELSLGPGENYTFAGAMGFQVVAAIMGALMGGVFLIFYVNVRFRDKPYGFAILAVAGAFVFIVAFITVVLGSTAIWIKTGHSLLDPEGRDLLHHFATNPMHFKNVLMWGLVVAITQLLLNVNDKFGPGLLWHFIRGKYHTPQAETRIFMFVDLKSSTTIAEQLGNERYYTLLRDFFADVTNAIIWNKGEVYQYVGDEVVLSWTLENGLKDNHCVQCFFDMRSAIDKKRATYLERYGLVPEFKAGMHYGDVTAGEIGIIKRDLTFSGDVLNTTARIQAKCNELGASFLTSGSMLELLSKGGISSHELGAIELRGKQEKMALSSIDLA